MEWQLRERADLSGGQIAWDRFGDGPAIVLVHGTPSWSYLWRGLIAGLSADHEVYVLDLLGYGHSPRTADQDMSVIAQGRALAELLELWQLDSPTLVGHDIGGATVLRAHLIHGLPVGRLVLVDAVVLNPWNTPTTQHIRSHLDAYRTMPSHIYEEVVKAHLRTAVDSSLDERDLAAYLAPWQGRVGQEAYFRKIAQWTDDDVGELEPLLTSIEVPVTLIWGRQDRWLEPSIATRLHDAIPGSELRWIADAGHFAPEDAPEAVTAAILDFVSRRNRQLD